MCSFALSIIALATRALKSPFPIDFRGIRSLKFNRRISLANVKTYHPQGIMVVGGKTYISSVEGQSQDPNCKGHLLSFVLGNEPTEIRGQEIKVPRVEADGKESLTGLPLTQNPMFAERAVEPSGKVIIRFYFIPHDQPDSAIYIYDADTQLSFSE